MSDNLCISAGVVAWSSGNHAQGVAAAARLLQIPATIVMPSDAPLVKYRNTVALGAEVLTYDRLTESCEEIATAIAGKRGAVLVASFDDRYIIAGQGTIGLEILDQAAALGLKIDRILCCCGGGGLIGGIATAIKAADPLIAIYSVEPEAFDDTARSLASGAREANAPGARSICDALLAPMPGTLTFPINKALLSGGLSVSDEEVKAAMRFAFGNTKLVAEPGGAVALAAMLQDKLPDVPGATVVVVSGGNVDDTRYAGILAEAWPATRRADVISA
jgi:threonine dehydratase